MTGAFKAMAFVLTDNTSAPDRIRFMQSPVGSD